MHSTFAVTQSKKNELIFAFNNLNASQQWGVAAAEIEVPSFENMEV